jgi:hypothetical protein
MPAMTMDGGRLLRKGRRLNSERRGEREREEWKGSGGEVEVGGKEKKFSAERGRNDGSAAAVTECGLWPRLTNGRLPSGQ